MKITAIISALLPLVAYAADFEHAEGKSPAIVGGNSVPEGQFIVLVSLQDNGFHFCGGSLINKNTVVTAAHCSTDLNLAQIKVRAGSLAYASGGQLVGVKRVYVNPNYDADTFNNDIAVWKLSKDIQPAKNLGFARLPVQGQDPAPSTQITVAGWGATEESSQEAPPRAQQVTILSVSRQTCKNKMDQFNPVTTNMWCAGPVQGGKDSCQGDSGGPALETKSRVLDGVVSWGVGCAEKDKFGVYTRVGNYINWIKPLAAM